MKRLIWLLAMATVVVACEPEKGSTDAASSAPSAAAEAKLSDEQLDTAEVPVDEDFEDEAEASITADNLDDQVAALEDELSGDK